MSDRYGRRPALLIGLTASAIAYVVFGFAESLWLLFLSRLVQGAGGGTTGVAQAYVADTMAPGERAKALGWLSAATSAGVAFGPVIGSFAAHLGRAAPGLVAAALCLLNVAFAWRWLPESRVRETGPPPAAAAGLAPGVDRAAPPRRAALPAALDLRHRHGGVRVADLGARALSRRGVRARRADASGRSSPTSGCCRSSCGACCWVRSWTAWVSCGRCGSARSLLALGLWLYPTPESLWTFAAVIPLVPIGTALLFPSTTSLMSRQSDPRELGTTMGVAQTFAGLARVAAPLLATMAFQRLGHGAPFYLARRLRGGRRCAGVPDPDRSQRLRASRGGGKSEGLMSTDDRSTAGAAGEVLETRLERLERRVAVLEALVRAGQRRRAGGQPPVAAVRRHRRRPAVRRAGPRAPPPRRPAAPPPSRLPDFDRAVDRPARLPRGRRGRPPDGHGLSAQALVRARVDLAGHALRRRRGAGCRWWARSAGGCTSGIAPTARRSSAAGCGIIYLSVWAACRLYEVIPPTTGIVGLAMVSVALAMIAFAINVEALGTTAALGAFMAPVLLGQRTTPTPTCSCCTSRAWPRGSAWSPRGAAGGSPCSSWRRAISGWAPPARASDAVPWALLLYGVIGGTAGLYVGLREQWWETRLLTFSGGWVLLSAASERMAAHWPVFIAGLILSAPVWWHALRNPRALPLRVGARSPARPDGASAAEGWSAGEALYFFTTPLLLGWAAYGLAPDRFDDTPGLLPLLVAVPYLLAGYLRARPPFALVGATAAAVAAQAQWEGTTQVWALLALGLLWPALDHRLGRSDGRWYGVLTWGAAMQHLLEDALQQRTAADAAFVGPWALALWGATAAALALAAGLFKARADEGEARLVRSGLWSVAGLLTLFGVTGEIRRYFELESSPRHRGAGGGPGGERLVADLRRRAHLLRLPPLDQAAPRRRPRGRGARGGQGGLLRPLLARRALSGRLGLLPRSGHALARLSCTTGTTARATDALTGEAADFVAQSPGRTLRSREAPCPR